MSGFDSRGWVRVALDCSGASVPAIEEALSAAGAVAISLENAGSDSRFESRFESWPPERPLWGTVRVSGLFPAGVNGPGRIASCLSPEILEGVRVSEIPETDWTRAGRDRIRPMRFGERLWICPTWADAPLEAASGVVVRLDPGLAFGTGAHPSTGLCLRHIESLGFEGRLVVDYGCGSGVLGIAALRLGARRCIAVDIDPRALVAARENAICNRVAERFDIMSPEGVDAAFRVAESGRCDVLVANVLAGPLAKLAGSFAELVATGGDLVLSGILSGQEAGLIETYAPRFRLATVAREDDWVLLAGPRTR